MARHESEIANFDNRPSALEAAKRVDEAERAPMNENQTNERLAIAIAAMDHVRQQTNVHNWTAAHAAGIRVIQNVLDTTHGLTFNASTRPVAPSFAPRAVEAKLDPRIEAAHAALNNQLLGDEAAE